MENQSTELLISIRDYLKSIVQNLTVLTVVLNVVGVLGGLSLLTIAAAVVANTVHHW